MRRRMRVLMMPAVLLAAGLTAGYAAAGGKCGKCAGAPGCNFAWGSPPPYWCDPYADLRPWPENNYLYDGPRNWHWWYPHGGFTAYPGEPGSGIQMGSDYSHVNWVASPTSNAQMVTEKLQALGVPLVPQETIYLGKNPGAVQKAKLPMPKNWIKEEEPEKAKEVDK